MEAAAHAQPARGEADGTRRITAGRTESGEAHVGPEGASLDIKPERHAGDLEVVVKEFEHRLVHHPQPNDPGARPSREGAEPVQGDVERGGLPGGGGERSDGAFHEVVGLLAKVPNGDVQLGLIGPAHVRRRLAQGCRGTSHVGLEEVGEGEGKEEAHAMGKVPVVTPR